MFDSEIQMKIGDEWYPVCRAVDEVMAGVLISILSRTTRSEYRIMEVSE